MPAAANRKGFTLVELMVVVAIFGIFLVVAGQAFGPFAGRSRETVRAAYTDVAAALDGALRDSMSGWGGLAQDKGVRDDAGLLPERYGIVFIRDPDQRTGDSGFYWAVQTQDRAAGSITYRRVILSDKREYRSPFIRLAKIVGKAGDSDPGSELASLAIMFKNPSGVMTFHSDGRRYSSPSAAGLPADAADTVSEFPADAPERRWTRYDLEFKDDLGKTAFTVTIRDDKRFYMNVP